MQQIQAHADIDFFYPSCFITKIIEETKEHIKLNHFPLVFSTKSELNMNLQTNVFSLQNKIAKFCGKLDLTIYQLKNKQKQAFFILLRYFRSPMYSALLTVLILHQAVSLTTYFGTANQWAPYGDGGITMLVNISSFNLTKTPYIFTRISCADYCWGVTGPTSIYDQSKNSFRVFLRMISNYGSLTAALATQYLFTVHYVLFVEEPTNTTAVANSTIPYVANQTTSAVNQTTTPSQKEVVDQTARDLIKVGLVIAVLAASALIVIAVLAAIILGILWKKNRSSEQPRGDASVMRERARIYLQERSGV